MLVASIIFLLISAPAQTILLMMGASKKSIEMCIEFLGIYAVWLGILQILDDTKLSHKLSEILSKPIIWCFGKTDEETKKNICLNVSSNILGLGGAATPFGIKAMQGLDDKTGVATKAMIMLVVVNSTGIQALPTTVIGMRAIAGSASPSIILLPTIISTIIPTALGIFLVKMFYKNKKSKQNENAKTNSYIKQKKIKVSKNG